MSEKLIVDNFLGIKHIELDVKPITILIGQQATGKSVCAKLLYFFRELIPNIFTPLALGGNHPSLDELFISQFKDFFPPLTWSDDKFSIKYVFDNSSIKVSRKNKSESEITLIWSRKLKNQILKFISTMDSVNVGKSKKGKIDIRDSILSLTEGIQRAIASDMFGGGRFSDQVYIPAVRSYYSPIEESAWEFMSSKRRTHDPFLVKFGSFYKDIKNKHIRLGKPEANRVVNTVIKQVLKGKVSFEKDDVFITHKDRRCVNISNCSSGQQEVIPIIMILEELSQSDLEYFVFIEEPEAHLFPNSQKDIVEFITTIFNQKQNDSHFFLTTHSPYILTAFNNLMYAGLIEKNADDAKKEELYKIVPKEKVLDPDMVGVYSLQDGGCTDIKDEDGLIDATVLDEVSNETAKTFGDLMELE